MLWSSVYAAGAVYCGWFRTSAVAGLYVGLLGLLSLSVLAAGGLSEHYLPLVATGSLVLALASFRRGDEAGCPVVREAPGGFDVACSACHWRVRAQCVEGSDCDGSVCGSEHDDVKPEMWNGKCLSESAAATDWCTV